jgi:hypothetical protein
MKAIKLTLIIFISALVINFIRNGRTFHIAKSLPFSNAPEKVGIYDVSCIVILLITAWGLYRINKNSKDE